MRKLVIKSRGGDINVNFKKDLGFLKKLLSLPNTFYAAGTEVHRVYRKKMFNRIPAEKLLVLELGEKNKTLGTVSKIYDRLMAYSAKKNVTIVSFGGGINQDVVGYAASTLYRGVNWIFVPTTLLAMADSSIGLKTSINHKGFKNLIGTFFPPSEIYVCPDFLDTLSEFDYSGGIGEIIKFLLMRENSLDRIDDSIKKIGILRKREDKGSIVGLIRESIEIKKSYMVGDEFDRGKRNLLNYGHELGHAIESASGFRISHGNGVIIGMIFANFSSVERGMLDKRTNRMLLEKILLPNLASQPLEKKYFKNSTLLEKFKKDKKRTSSLLPLVLPRSDFKLTKITDFGFDEFDKSLDSVREVLF